MIKKLYEYDKHLYNGMLDEQDPVHPFDLFNWVESDVYIPSIKKHQKLIFPDFYSENAKSIIADKYMVKISPTLIEETDFRNTIRRIANINTRYAIKEGYINFNLQNFNKNSYNKKCSIFIDFFLDNLNIEENKTSSNSYIKELVYTDLIPAHSLDNKNLLKTLVKSYSDFIVYRHSLMYLLANQMFSFNSPVWFNVGNPYREFDNYQIHACFILGIDDNMESIHENYVQESEIFRFGSGAGANRGKLRSNREEIRGGGLSSGVCSFQKIFDTIAQTTKSGGISRRAAKMEILPMDHAEIKDFIWQKTVEEKKAKALIQAGFSADFTDPKGAYGSVFFQNSNQSVSIPDAFMQAVEKKELWYTVERKNTEVFSDDTTYFSIEQGVIKIDNKTGQKFLNPSYKYAFLEPGKYYKIIDTHYAEELFNDIALCTWQSGDPGVQFISTMNKFSTIETEYVTASNPCVTGDTMITLANGKSKRIDSIVGIPTNILTNLDYSENQLINGSFSTGIKPVYKLKTKTGLELKVTNDHKIYTLNRGFVEAKNLIEKDQIKINFSTPHLKPLLNKEFYQLIGLYLGNGGSNHNSLDSFAIDMSKEDGIEILNPLVAFFEKSYGSKAILHETATTIKYNVHLKTIVDTFKKYVDLSHYSHEKYISDEIFNLDISAQKYILQGLFTADGTVASYGGKSNYISLDSTSLKLLKTTQLLLLNFGIKSKIYENRSLAKIKLLPDSNRNLKEYECKAMHSLRISRSSRVKFEKYINFMDNSLKQIKLSTLNEEISTYKDKEYDYLESFEYIGEERVYDLTEPVTSSFIANGIVVHNCSEYIHLDDTACNLGSINLIKFYNKESRIFSFDYEKLAYVSALCTVYLDVWNSFAKYPSKKIKEKSIKSRTIGLGFTNLGSVIILSGNHYGSEESLELTSNIQFTINKAAIYTSSLLGHTVGSCEVYEANKNKFNSIYHSQTIALNNHNIKGFLAKKFYDFITNNDPNFEPDCYRNAQVTVVAPTGTISFAMDCNTTGIEPELGFIKYKNLVGGSTIKIINDSFEWALKNKVCPKRKDIDEMIKYLIDNETIVGYFNTSAAAKEHNNEEIVNKITKFLATSFDDNNPIDYKDHINIMAAAQAYLSGGISKTINMPTNATVEDIKNAYTYAFNKNLKCVAIYRNNSKGSQPLEVKSKSEEPEIQKTSVPVLKERKKLPENRMSITHKFSIAGHEGYMTVSFFESGEVGELFVKISKEGSTIAGLMDAWSIAISMLLQYGAPLEKLVDKFSYMSFDPSGFTQNDDIKTCHSIVDYVSRQLPILQEKFNKESLNYTEKSLINSNFSENINDKFYFSIIETNSTKPVSNVSKNTGPLCMSCGSITIRTGSCYTCQQCGSTSGCG